MGCFLLLPFATSLALLFDSARKAVTVRLSLSVMSFNTGVELLPLGKQTARSSLRSN
jgi:hypothetical protein